MLEMVWKYLLQNLIKEVYFVIDYLKKKWLNICILAGTD